MSSLFDYSLFQKSIEAAYLNIWEMFLLRLHRKFNIIVGKKSYAAPTFKLIKSVGCDVNSIIEICGESQMCREALEVSIRNETFLERTPLVWKLCRQ